MTHARAFCLGLALSLGCGSAAFAADADCLVVGKAMTAGGSQPGVRQTQVLIATGEPVGLSGVLTRDAMHVREAADARWQTMPFGVAERTKTAEAMLKSLPLSDCAKQPPETVRGVAAEVYDYTQRNPMGSGEKLLGRIWIAADGLPVRVRMTDSTAMDFEYGDFPAPE